MTMRDVDAYRRYPHFRKWYHKPLLYDALGVPHGIFPELPERWPVIAKPIVNLEGVAAGVRLCRSRRELEAAQGCVWMPVLEGLHLSWDVNLNGTVRCALGALGGHPALFEYWTTIGTITESVGALGRLRKTLDTENVVPIVNIEMIGDTVIEVHARPAMELRPLFDGAARYCVPIWATVERPGFDLLAAPVFGDHKLVSTMEHEEPEVGPPGWWRYGLLYGDDLEALRAAAAAAMQRIERT